MSRLQIPVTATNLPEWIRRCADAVNSIMTRLVSLETRPNEGASFRYESSPLPTSPQEGQTVYDQSDKVIKTWDGAAWRAHY